MLNDLSLFCHLRALQRLYWLSPWQWQDAQLWVTGDAPNSQIAQGWMRHDSLNERWCAQLFCSVHAGVTKLTLTLVLCPKWVELNCNIKKIKIYCKCIYEGKKRMWYLSVPRNRATSYSSKGEMNPTTDILPRTVMLYTNRFSKVKRV